MKRLFFIIFFISCFCIINAQESAKSLTVGNQWYYSIIPEVVVGDTIIQGNQYFIINTTSYPHIRYERSDSSAVYEYNVGLEQEFTVYDFDWELNNGYFANNCYIYVSDKGSGSFLNTWREFITIVQDETGFWFEERTYCREFGLYHRWGWDMQANWESTLNGALIDGIVYGTIVNSNNDLLEPCSILKQNHPNLFNPSTTIEFSLWSASNVEISIFNIKGQKIKNLASNQFTKGSHSIIWNGDYESGESVSSGIYYYKLNVNGKTEAVKKCLLLK